MDGGAVATIWGQGPIEWFRLKGLHGYKDIEVDLSGKATVIVAENGTGKTTVLNALNAFITRRFHRLSSINFSSLQCKFRDSLAPLELTKAHLSNNDEEADVAIKSLSKGAGVAESDIYDFIRNEYEAGAYTKLRGHPIVRRLYLNSHHDHEDLEGVLDNLHFSLDRSLSEGAKQMVAEVRQHMDGVEVVYLPTYRRIERPLMRETKGRSSRLEASGRTNGRWSRSAHDDMVFGLVDVQDRLVEMTEDIERRSNLEYRALSARMLDELLRGQGARQAVANAKLPELDALYRFLNRVGHGSGQTSSLLHGIQSLYESQRIDADENWVLRYFLSRLDSVIEQTRETEQTIEQFVAVCNSYLTLSSDEKSLSFDAQALRVVVQNAWANCQISLDDLSSGEKQIVSLMARLYLYDKPKLVLVDEPELSLSIDWQRKVLPDVVNSKSVVQLLAITHSPFVFENELDSCARPLRMTRTGVA